MLKTQELWRVVKASDEKEAQIAALLGLLETRTRLDIQSIKVEEVSS